jgi:hypothetical protein
MKAFKTFLNCPPNQKPEGIPNEWPWQVQDCSIEESETLENLGYTVVSDEDYQAYLEANQSALDSWNQNNINQKTAKEIKIFDYLENTVLDKSVPPVRVDFVTGLDIKLHRKSILVKGECIREEFYASVSVNPTTGALTYSNLIVKEETTYTRNSLGFPVSKLSTISYMLRDGTYHPTIKTISKVYSSLEQISEGKTRRGNLVDNLQMPCIGLISIAMTGSQNPSTAVILEGRRFLADYKNEFESFVAASDKAILSCFNDVNNPKYAASSNYSWIDAQTPYGITIRQFLINELTI